MARENAAAKARRLLVEGRLLVLEVDAHHVSAKVRGDGTVHDLAWDGRRGWWCTCPAHGRCSHLLALGQVVAVDLAPHPREAR